MNKLTNLEIYNYALRLNCFTKNLVFPVKFNFYFQKNGKKLLELGQEIEEAKNKILEDENIINKEEAINELFDIEQEIRIYKIKLEDLKDISLTLEQMNALMFMIDDEEKEEEKE